jgi:hypothetical protein
MTRRQQATRAWSIEEADRIGWLDVALAGVGGALAILAGWLFLTLLFTS